MSEINCDTVIDCFILQYPCFMESVLLIEKLFNVFNYFISFTKTFPKNIVKFVNQLIILKFEEEFHFNYQLKDKLNFMYKHIIDNVETKNHFSIEELDTLMDIINEDEHEEMELSLKRLKGRKKSYNIFNKQNSLLPQKLSICFNILEWDEKEIARQLTQISYFLMSNIEYKELLSAKWTNKQKYSNSPNIMKIIDRFNTMTLWIIEEIMCYDYSKVRALVVEKFILVANECKNICNFNDCINIVSALNSFILKSLPKTFKRINKKIYKVFVDLNSFCSYENNYSNLRNAINESQGKPCIPYLGLILKELAFNEEGSKYIKDNYLINLEKIKTVDKAILNFIDYNSKSYPAKSVDQLAFLWELEPKTEEELEKIADKLGTIINIIILEPKFNLTSSKIKTKRFSKTDNKFTQAPKRRSLVNKYMND